MTSTLERLRSLATLVAEALPPGRDLGTLTTAELTEATRLVAGIRHSLGEVISLLASNIERQSARELGTDGLAQRNGFKDGTGFVQDLTGVGRSEAAQLIRVGELLETARAVAPEAGTAGPGDPCLETLAALPGSWDAPIAVALRNTWLTAAQGDALRRCLGTPRVPELDATWREGVLSLIGDCWAASWSPEDVAKAAKRLRASLDSIAAHAEADARYRMRSLKRVVRASGLVHYDIDLDPESDARFYGPIKRILSPRFGGPRFVSDADIAAAKTLEEDPRTNEQLQVDTLIDLIDRAVATDDNELFKTGEPQVMVAATAADLAKARERAGRLGGRDGEVCVTGGGGEVCVTRGDGDVCVTRGGDDDGAVGEGNGGALTSDGGIAWIDGIEAPITATDALRMICASGFTPVLFDESGRAIDVGSDQRYFTRKQRRAMAKRDGGCMYPGCERPPGDCEAHHVNPWAAAPQNHRSEVRDGILICRRHHKMVHDFGARIERRGADFWLLWPRRAPRRLLSKSAVMAQLRAQGKVA